MFRPRDITPDNPMHAGVGTSLVLAQLRMTMLANEDIRRGALAPSSRMGDTLMCEGVSTFLNLLEQSGFKVVSLTEESKGESKVPGVFRDAFPDSQAN